MPDFLVLVFIFVAVVVGFFIGRTTGKSAGKFTQNLPWTQKRYFEGLTYLLNEQTDESLDNFFAGVDVNTDTLDVHLSLGGLLRRKGEVLRAVKVHQNLLSRTNLTRHQSQIVQLELAKDYVRSGLLDRAETLLKELIEHNAIARELRLESLEQLIDVYQDTKDWLKAIDVADRLTTRKFAMQSDKWREVQAQYSCELAEASQLLKDWFETRKWIRVALRYDKNCVRASLLQARLDMNDNKYPTAIATLKMIPKQNLAHASEMVRPLVECYQKLDGESSLLVELQVYLEKQNDLVALNHLCVIVLKSQGAKKMLEVLQKLLPRYSNQEATLKLVETLLVQYDGGEYSFQLFQSVIDKLISVKPRYRCQNCGFEGGELYWLCPSCKKWAAMISTSYSVQ